MRVSAERILIVLLGAIGDVTRALPLSHRVRAGLSRRAHRLGGRAARGADPRRASGARRRGWSSSAAAAPRPSSRSCARVRARAFDLVARPPAARQERARERRVARAGAHRVSSPEREGAQLALEHAHDRAGRAARLEARAVSRASPTSSSCPSGTALRRDAHGRRGQRASTRSLGAAHAVRSPRSSSARRGRAASGSPSATRAVVDALAARGLDAVLVGGTRRPRARGGDRAPRARRAPLDLTARTLAPRELRRAGARARVAIGPDSGPDAPRGRRGHAGRVALGRDDAGALGARGLAGPGRSSDACPCAPCYLRRCPIGRQCMQRHHARRGSWRR